MPQKQLAQREETLPEIAPESLGLVGEYDESDLTIPCWYLVQRTSTSFPDAKPGQFATRDGRVADSLIIVPLRIAATRALWPEGKADGRPICASNDRVYGRPFGEAQEQHLCRECGHYDDKPWTTERGKGCYRGYALIMAVQSQDDEIALMRLKGTSVKPFKTIVLSHFLRRRGQTPQPAWSKTFEFRAEEQNTEEGPVYVLMPKLLPNTKETKPYQEMAQHLRDVRVEAVEPEAFEDESAADAAANIQQARSSSSRLRDGMQRHPRTSWS